MKTAIKNQVTSTVSKYNSNLLSAFTDAFGVSGRSFLKMLAENFFYNRWGRHNLRWYKDYWAYWAQPSSLQLSYGYLHGCRVAE
jgi:hypothetical protein